MILNDRHKQVIRRAKFWMELGTCSAICYAIDRACDEYTGIDIKPELQLTEFEAQDIANQLTFAIQDALGPSDAYFNTWFIRQWVTLHDHLYGPDWYSNNAKGFDFLAMRLCWIDRMLDIGEIK